jgi:uncharacterized protein (DUF1330 family)
LAIKPSGCLSWAQAAALNAQSSARAAPRHCLEPPLPDAYVIVDMQISDMEQYKLYLAEAPASVKAAGGEYLIRGGRFETLEGDWQPGRMAMLRFPSYDAAKAWYDSQAYRAARAKRLGATTVFNMVLVEGVSAPV